MKLVLTKRQDDVACPVCSVIGGVQHRSVALPVAFTICAACIGTGVWGWLQGAIWWFPSQVFLAPIFVLPWFGWCQHCGARFQMGMNGRWQKPRDIV